MNLKDLRIMVVDDNGNMRQLITTILTAVGITRIVEVASGADALSRLAVDKPDVLLVDYVMDGMTGVELTARIRAEIDGPGERLPIVMLTGYSELWRLTEAKAAGADEFLVKPFTTKALLTRIHRVVGGSEKAEPAA